MAQNLHNTSTDDLSFLEKKNPNALSAKDVIITIVHNLHWIILCAAIGGAIAWLVSDRAERIYESHAKVKIQSVTRNMADGNVVTILEAVSNRRTGDAWNTLNDEIIVLKSETAMLEVARRLNLGMSYYYKTKVVKRVKDLYTDSPIDVALLDVNESDDLTFVVTVSPDSLYVLETSDGEEVKGRLRDTVSTPLGRVCVQPTWALRDLYYDNPIQVKHR
ncbi:MAG: hypothetical protein II047_08500, partial [Bacteroidales bacterium]|nr:hypothetical protein [Bacteroidales bacterium]